MTTATLQAHVILILIWGLKGLGQGHLASQCHSGH